MCRSILLALFATCPFWSSRMFVSYPRAPSFACCRETLLATLMLVFSRTSARCSVCALFMHALSIPSPQFSAFFRAHRATIVCVGRLCHHITMIICAPSHTSSVCTGQFFFLKNREKCITGLVRCVFALNALILLSSLFATFS